MLIWAYKPARVIGTTQATPAAVLAIARRICSGSNEAGGITDRDAAVSQAVSSTPQTDVTARPAIRNIHTQLAGTITFRTGFRVIEIKQIIQWTIAAYGTHMISGFGW